MNSSLLGWLVDSAGLLCGALVGFLLARWLGFPLFTGPGGAVNIAVAVAVGLAGGIGLGAARRWRLERGAAGNGVSER